MVLRPLHVFSAIATAMVGWFATRMWNGSSHEVWRASAMMAGWAPVLAAVMVAYVTRVGPREDSVAAAWLVRAIGMHCVLLWMVGASDWLRGPPDQAPAWNTDVGTPVVFVAFVPCFALCHALLRGLFATHRRLTAAASAPVAAAAPATARSYREPARPVSGATLRRARPALAPFVGAAGLALFAWAPALTTLPVTSAALGFALTARTFRVTLVLAVALAGNTLLLAGHDLAMRWPVTALATVAVVLGASALRARLAVMAPPRAASAALSA